MQRRTLTTLAALAMTLVLASCGSESVQTNLDDGLFDKDPAGVGNFQNADDATRARVVQGANLFAERCSGCHTMAAAGTQGGAERIKERERTDGPNFDVRRETYGSVIYALANGGFSGAIMPQNLAVGEDAAKIAEFLCRYAGMEAEATAGPDPVKSAAERCKEKGAPPAEGGTPQPGAPDLDGDPAASGDGESASGGATPSDDASDDADAGATGE
ncbi:MAG: cytochrome c [Solirubrobacteraceae bacterium]|nr:cytochrome c [Solirubrobacteraceae bacterium]